MAVHRFRTDQAHLVGSGAIGDPIEEVPSVGLAAPIVPTGDGMGDVVMGVVLREAADLRRRIPQPVSAKDVSIRGAEALDTRRTGLVSTDVQEQLGHDDQSECERRIVIPLDHRPAAARLRAV